ncbi:T9SS type A sorting domain-containing protein [candidate division KSB1 bacterium]|nr:T9SS type A sorting domain-containing protein [candidate division KSB1 bacterium]
MKSSIKFRLLTGTLILMFLTVLAGAQTPEQREKGGYILIKAAPSGPDVTTTTTTYENVPDLTCWFYQYYPSHVVITVSAEAEVSSGKRMFLRAMVDGHEAKPTNVVFANEGYTGTHSFNFSADVDGGCHHVEIQWLVDPGGTAYLGDRTVIVATAPNFINTVSPPSGPDVTTTSGNFEDVPGLSQTIVMPDDGDAVITITGEAETSNNKRMFLRVLVDGQPCSPGDVVFVVGGYKGTRSFTFVKNGVTKGSHSAQVQWMVDSGGTAYMGDRSFTIGYSNLDLIVRGIGGILSVSAPSGPDKTTTSTSWVDVPDLSANIKLPVNGNISVSLTAEANATAGKRMFVRAVVDGQPLDPTDVVFAQGDFTGTCCMNFVSPAFGDGNFHQVGLQWLVDGGGTAYLGDRNMTVKTSPTPCPDMTDPFNGVAPVIGDHPLLVILWDPKRPTDPAPSKADVENLIFGGKPSVRDYFIENSHNLFFMNNAGVLGWYNADKPPEHYWAAKDEGDTDKDGWISGHVEKWAEAVRKADLTFDFASFDKNGNGTLETDELGVLMVIPQNSPFGTVRVPLGREYPTAEPLIVDGVVIPLIAEAYIGAPPDLDLVAHELSHLFLKMPDMYFNFFFPYAAGVYSLMDANYVDNHLDPFHKIRLGWIQAPNILESGLYPFDAVENSHVAYILHDPAHGAGEYFIVENRHPGLNYDSALPDAGLAVWHIIENADIYKNLPAPSGVSVSDWATIGANDWGRRAIRMIRPVYGPPFNNAKALWDGSDPETGYDLYLDWADGSPSGFAIKNISPSGPYMEAFIQVPWETTGVSSKKLVSSAQPAHFQLEQNYPNPFNPETTFLFKLRQDSHVCVKIFNMLGQEVVTLLDGKLSAGNHAIRWNATDRNGQNVPSGIYLYQVEAAGTRAVKKMTLVR